MPRGITGRALPVVLGALLVSACASNPEADYVRGRGLDVASLPVADQIAIYQEAVGGAFTVGDPSLYLLLNPRFLPRTAGLQGGEPLAPALRDGLLRTRLLQGTCQPLVNQGPLEAAQCRAPMAGYVVQFSQVFRLPADTVEVYLFVRRFSTPTSVGIRPLNFERIYKVVKRASGWRAVVEGRVQSP